MRISIVLGNNEAPRGLVTLALFGTFVTLIGDSPVAKVNGNVGFLTLEFDWTLTLNNFSTEGMYKKKMLQNILFFGRFGECYATAPKYQ
ncbi:hypothetical protein OUZ56_015438 [Daphnia magna]|uniref:Uncharacterized protein n=1 Tax=Daphnia magna TaxID=35525 RepID=A0ABR0AN22_9CRUS|nr:hypothetical protein OUZ56_015438 [Daphnia magna]